MQIPVTDNFGGIDCVSTPDNVSDMNSPDSRNGDISTPGSEIKRKGLTKSNTTAYSYVLNYMVKVEVKGVSYTLVINTNGDMITL